MKKLNLILALFALPVLFMACGGEAPVEEVETVEETTIEVVIVNDLGGWDIMEILVDPSDSPWTDNRIDEPLIQGERFAITLEEAGTYDIMLIDEDGDSYSKWAVEIGEDGFTWEVTLDDLDWGDDYDEPYMPEEGEAAVTIYNGLGDWTIWYVYCDPSDGPWGADRLGADLLEPGDEFTFFVPAGNTYDIKVEDVDGDTYTLWGIDIDEEGYYWEVTLSDIDG